MPIFKMFSQREKERRGEVPDVYQYETIPDELRVKVLHIWWAIFGKLHRNFWGEVNSISTAKAYEDIHKELCYRYGKLGLNEHNDSAYESVCNFFLQAAD